MMQWSFTPYIIPLLVVILVAGALASAAWLRGTAGAKLFAFLMVTVGEWSVGYALELSGVDLPTKIFWGQVQYAGIAIVPVAWLIFALHFTRRSHYLTRRNLIGLMFIPLLTLLVVWTNDNHGLLWKQTRLDSSGPFLALDVSYGTWFWVHLSYSYILLLLGTILLVNMLLRSIYLYRRQTMLLLAGALAPWLGNGLYIFGYSPVPNLDLTPFAFTFSGVVMGWAFYRYRLLHIRPIALQTVLESMSDSVIVIDAQNRVVDLNPAAQQIVGFRAHEAIGQPAEQIFFKWPDLIKQYGQATEAQAEITLDDNQPQRYFDMRISPFYNRQNRLTGRLIVLRDITARKRVEQELALARDQALEASRLKSELLAKVSHELRTPLGAILGFSEMLALDVYGPVSDEQRHTAQEIMDSTEYLTGLVNELLDQAQLDNGKLKLNFINFTPAELLSTIQTRMIPLAEAKGLTLKLGQDPNLPPQIYSDLARLQQILGNLVSNAIKFTETGKIEVFLYRPDFSHWALRVSDTGPGIPSEAQAYIFDPFRQVDGSITRQQGGSGLGLSIVQQLTQLMGGRITLDSEVGQGSTFTVLLPLPPVTEKILK